MARCLCILPSNQHHPISWVSKSLDSHIRGQAESWKLFAGCWIPKRGRQAPVFDKKAASQNYFKFSKARHMVYPRRRRHCERGWLCRRKDMFFFTVLLSLRTKEDGMLGDWVSTSNAIIRDCFHGRSGNKKRKLVPCPGMPYAIEDRHRSCAARDQVRVSSDSTRKDNWTNKHWVDKLAGHKRTLCSWFAFWRWEFLRSTAECRHHKYDGTFSANLRYNGETEFVQSHKSCTETVWEAPGFRISDVWSFAKDVCRTAKGKHIL